MTSTADIIDSKYTPWYIYTVVHEYFQVLADPNRLKIIELLRNRECAVNDLVSKMAIQQSGVSRHLRILEDSGFVQMRPSGTKRLYSLRHDRFAELDRWLSDYRQLWLQRLDAFEDALSRKQQQRLHRRKRKK